MRRIAPLETIYPNSANVTVTVQNGTLSATLNTTNQHRPMFPPVWIGGHGNFCTFDVQEYNAKGFELVLDLDNDAQYDLTGPSINRASAVRATKGLIVEKGYIARHYLAKAFNKIEVTVSCTTGKIKVLVISRDEDSRRQTARNKKPIELAANQSQTFKFDKPGALNFTLKVTGLESKSTYDLTGDSV
ncbi:MAG: hypothetical protein WCS37_03385 [Chloroflexota bacterium]